MALALSILAVVLGIAAIAGGVIHLALSADVAAERKDKGRA